MKNKLVIFGFPRSGTKLLAEAHIQNGYHNFGEFMDVYSSDIIISERPHSVRKSVSDQNNIKNKSYEFPTEFQYKQSLNMIDRFTTFQKFEHITPSIVTIWPESFYMIPNLLNKLSDRFFLCTRRSDKFQHLLSRLITKYNLNYNEEHLSKPFVIDLSIVDVFFNSFYKTEILQDQIVQSGKGIFVDLDQLICGKTNLGFDYQITTNDQHINLENYILNLDQVKQRIEKIQNFISF